MFYVCYGILYVISLLPLRVLYLLSDASYLILYYVIRYRRTVVLENLRIAFPEKTITEHQAISRQFYRRLTGTFIESVKLLSISRTELARRCNADTALLDRLIAEGKNVHVLVGHQFNWEFANLRYASVLPIPFVVVYMEVHNKAIDRVFQKSRSRFGSVLVSTRSFRHKMHHLLRQQFVLVLAADQNPGLPRNAFWTEFFGKPVPFVTGPGKGAVRHNTAVVYMSFQQSKRGYYSFQTTLLAENGADHSPEELTFLYKNALEQSIRKDPPNYLWSHRRWRHKWQEGYPPVLQYESAKTEDFHECLHD